MVPDMLLYSQQWDIFYLKTARYCIEIIYKESGPSVLVGFMVLNSNIRYPCH
jgi:hypothetical protein